MRFLGTFYRFLYGRYAMRGVDSLNKLLAIVAILLSAVNLFLGSITLYIIQTALIFWMFYRLFSKNIPARVSENEVFKRFERNLKTSISIFGKRFKERKTHIYKTCPNCKAKLRFRRIKGTHNAHCPKCNKNFMVNVR